MSAAGVTADATRPADEIRTRAATVGEGAAWRTPAAPARLFQPGQLIADRYVVVRFLACGGMGEVYEVEDLELDVRLAIKTIRAERLGDDDGIARLKREVLAARRVTHPNVVRLYDVGFHVLADQREVAFITMDLLVGETLDAYLSRRGPLHPDEAGPLLAQLAAALDAAHAVDIVHRDFKTQNVILVEAAGDGAPRAVVTDFGLAEAGADLDGHSTATVEFIGTPAYMAPEQISRRSVITRAADIYALGVVMFEMVTGRLPWSGPTALATAVRRLDEPPPSPRRHAPDLPAAWEAAILRCLDREPAARFASAAAVVRAVGEPAPSRWRGRRWRTLLVAAAASIGIAALIGTAWRVVTAVPGTVAAAPPPPSAIPDGPAAARLRAAARLDVALARVQERLQLDGDRETAARGVEEARAVGDRALEAEALVALGRVETARGDLDAAADALGAASTLGAETSSTRILIDAWTQLGMVFERQGLERDAEAILGRAVNALREAPADAYQVEAIAQVSEALADGAGDPARGPIENLARGKRATQSSTSGTGEAGLAIDGRVDGAAGGGPGAVTRTAAAPNAWWQVDLGEAAWIDEIAVTGGSCCGDHPVGAYLLVSATPFAATDLGGVLAQRDVVRIYRRTGGAATYRVGIHAAGRYVRIQLTGTGPLSLAEVEVRGLRNLALGKPATQSSTVLAAGAERAVDGNPDGDYYAGSLTHTGNDQPSWWQLDLGPGVHYIDRIMVFNRTDCCFERLARFWVHVSDEPLRRDRAGKVIVGASTWSRHYELPTGAARYTMSVRRHGGRYILVELDRPWPLSLAEVMVFGR